ncbi:alpha/beta fold hydrolase [Nocardia sp. NPDC020380]|uniref:alpha/beta fold hydrolase n=1 Tax=Nocardia sp. NPDC020380 TaxID=3364309 RepID=UPI0037BC1C21
MHALAQHLNGKFAAAHPEFVWFDWMALGPKDQLAEQLIAGKESAFYGSFYQAAKGGAIDKAESDAYIAAYSKPGRTHAGLEYYRQKPIGDKAIDAMIAKDGKLTVPILALGGEDSMGASVGTMMSRVAANVTADVVPGADHWVLDENHDYVLASLRKLLTR